MKFWLLVFTLIIASESQASVVSSDKHSFILEISKSVNVNSATAYQQFIKVGDWWNADHTYFGDAKNLVITPKAGGCFCEINGDKQVLHMLISYVVPNKEIRMLGGLGPLQMMAVNGAMSWKFNAVDAHTTQITMRYSVSGTIKGGLDKLAAVVDRVQTEQVNLLAKKLNAQK